MAVNGAAGHTKPGDGADRYSALQAGIRYEAGGVLDRALDHYRVAAASPDPDEAVEGLRRQADVLRTQCEWQHAVEMARSSAAAARGAGLATLEAEALNAEAAVYQSQGDLPAARALYERMLELTEDARVRGIALQNLGSIAAEGGDLAEAETRFLESFNCFDRAGYERGGAIALTNYGRCLLDQGDTSRAEPILVQALGRAQLLGDLEIVAIARLNLGEALLRRGESEQAEQLASAAFGYFGTTSNRWRQIECLRLLGDIALYRDRRVDARAFYNAGIRAAVAVGALLEQRRLDARLRATETERAS